MVSVTAVTGGPHYDRVSVVGTATSSRQSPPRSALFPYTTLFRSPAISVDKQVSLDGGLTWLDQGTLLQDPTTLVGNNIYFRAIVTDTGPTTLTDVTLTDLDGDGLTVVAATLTHGQSATSNMVSVTAVTGGPHYDRVSVVGTATAGGQSQTTGASDTADYSAVTP